MEYPILKGLDDKRVQDILVSFFRKCSDSRTSEFRGLDYLITNTELEPHEARGFSHDVIAYNIISNVGARKLTEILIYLMNFGIEEEHYNYLKAVFYKNGFDPNEIFNGEFVSLDSLREPDKNELAENWLKKNAPTEVYQKIQEAFNELGKNHTDDALGDCRQALEKLTINANFSTALNELCDKGIIKKGTRDKKNDYEMLQTVYHYISTLGSHTANKIPKPSIEQARFGYMLTQSALWYLIQELRGKNSLNEWVEIK